MTKLTWIGCVVLCAIATPVTAQGPVWNPSPIKECDLGGQIHHVEAAPFVTLPYGLGN
jgi:hypothetical protein